LEESCPIKQGLYYSLHKILDPLHYQRPGHRIELAFSSSTVIVTTSGIDLSKRGVINSKQITSSLSQQLQQQQPPNDNNRSISAELYANLLMQLRRASDVATAANDTSPAFKLTAAARKERLKYQPCFQCPVCKKR
jgi:hypothetical protein